MSRELCFWSIGDGQHSHMLQTLVNSFRAVGMQEDFHVISDREIAGAITHKVASFDKSCYWFKFTFLQQVIKNLDYDYCVFLDADNYFVRKPPPLLDLMQGSPVHAFLESDCTLPSPRPEWHRCPLPIYVDIMRECGITQEAMYNVNGGLFIVKHSAIDLVCELAEDFWKHSFLRGYVFTDEPPLAYVVQMLCKDSSLHLLRDHTNVWCSDWLGCFEGRVPDGKEWIFKDYMKNEIFTVNPAIVHALKSKEALVVAGR